jgi:hypothetical protein
MNSQIHFGTPQHNVNLPSSVAIDIEVKVERLLEVTPDDNLLEGTPVEDSCGIASDMSLLDSQDGVVNVGSDILKEPCVYCGQTPCDWALFKEEIVEECEVLEELKHSNKEIRHHAYRLYTRLKHGVLRKYDRRPLPICVRGEIMDNWPDPNRSYVGFQAALRDVSDGV